MFDSTAKQLLVYLAFLFYLTGCGAPSGSGDSSSSGDSSGSGAPPSSITRVAPSVNAVTSNGDTILNWNDVSADQYRVLYWRGNDAPQEHMTTSQAYTLPPLSSGDYTVIVEAYDELGNSLFSAPVTLEVL